MTAYCNAAYRRYNRVDSNAVARFTRKVACIVNCICLVGTVYKSSNRKAGVCRGSAYSDTVPKVICSPCNTCKITNIDTLSDQVDRAVLCTLNPGAVACVLISCVESNRRCRTVAGYREVTCSITGIAGKVRFLNVELIGGTVYYRCSVGPASIGYCCISKSRVF